jgi:hypothetical protein
MGTHYTLPPGMEAWDLVWITEPQEGAEGRDNPTAFIGSRSGSVNMMLRLDASQQAVAEEFFQLALALEGGLITSLKEQLPALDGEATNFEI